MEQFSGVRVPRGPTARPNMVFPTKSSEMEPYTRWRSNTDQRAFPTFSATCKETFWGYLNRHSLACRFSEISATSLSPSAVAFRPPIKPVIEVPGGSVSRGSAQDVCSCAGDGGSLGTTPTGLGIMQSIFGQAAALGYKRGRGTTNLSMYSSRRSRLRAR